MKRANYNSGFLKNGLCLLMLLLPLAHANAAVLLPLEARLNGMAYYDPNLGITWATAANIAGESTLTAAHTAVDTLMIEGVSAWRLPNADINNDGIAVDCKGKSIDTCSLDNELSFMLNIRGISAAAPGPFTDLQADWYWSASDNPDNPPRVFAWLMNDAAQSGFGDAHPDNTGLRTWAVRDGDVAVVPVPAAMWFFGSGLIGMIGVAKRKAG